MYRIRSAIFVFSSLALAMVWHPSANAQETSNVETANAKVRTLQQERVDVLQRAVELALEQYRAGTLDFRSVHATQRDLLDAQLDMAKTREERIRRSQITIEGREGVDGDFGDAIRKRADFETGCLSGKVCCTSYRDTVVEASADVTKPRKPQ